MVYVELFQTHARSGSFQVGILNYSLVCFTLVALLRLRESRIEILAYIVPSIITDSAIAFRRWRVLWVLNS